MTLGHTPVRIAVEGFCQLIVRSPLLTRRCPLVYYYYSKHYKASHITQLARESIADSNVWPRSHPRCSSKYEHTSGSLSFRFNGISYLQDSRVTPSCCIFRVVASLVLNGWNCTQDGTVWLVNRGKWKAKANCVEGAGCCGHHLAAPTNRLFVVATAPNGRIPSYHSRIVR